MTPLQHHFTDPALVGAWAAPGPCRGDMLAELVNASVGMSIAEVAKLVGISGSLARQLARQNQFPGAFRLGGLIPVHGQVLLEQFDNTARCGSLASHWGERLWTRRVCC
jgi:hypothetical protein